MHTNKNIFSALCQLINQKFISSQIQQKIQFVQNRNFCDQFEFDTRVSISINQVVDSSQRCKQDSILLFKKIVSRIFWKQVFSLYLHYTIQSFISVAFNAVTYFFETKNKVLNSSNSIFLSIDIISFDIDDIIDLSIKLTRRNFHINISSTWILHTKNVWLFSRNNFILFLFLKVLSSLNVVMNQTQKISLFVQNVIWN